MRITNNMLSSQLLLNLNRNAQQMNNTQTQLATGRKINKPSDDPVGITYSLRYRAELSSNEQYQKNVDSVISWLEFNDTVMNQAGSVLQRLRELTVQGSTGTNPQSALDSINEEVKELKEELIDISNSKLNGKYIFNGETYDIQPYDFPKNPDGTSDTTNVATVVTDKGIINFVVGESVQLPINVNGNEVFGSGTEKDNLFVTANNIMKALTEGDTEELAKQLDNIDTRMNKMLAIRSEIGAKSNRVDLMLGRLDDLNINLTNLQSKVEDADYAELAMQSKIQENIYNASLSAGAKIISPSLVDFLR
ncbi:flagellar hook-associated protein 3 FlgL [Paenibacillus amylolyticus]|uniref:Flagellar hook-associated protein 3 FlgL n=1 Tax=Paenibacillus amylolyticus TaxID=1451 RepID=A0AAP5H7L7_PAEAM|nr:flagellar hook-associated protein FlgL [Paenibacillus amylolyticus]MDR6726536.1 flagellar hook-associated protein 3 FlgL [Paenibacillus amylolyticus]